MELKNANQERDTLNKFIQNMEHRILDSDAAVQVYLL